MRPLEPSLFAALALAVAFAGCADDANSTDTEGGGRSPYAGLAESPIRGLSEEEIRQLRDGDGMGLSLPAELNGVPGPKHVLELADELGLGAGQRERVEVIRAEVVAEAQALGAALLETHAALDRAFRDGPVDEETLRALLGDLERDQAALRFAHLHAHLRTAEVLSAHQRAVYGELRGYGAGDHAGHGH